MTDDQDTFLARELGIAGGSEPGRLTGSAWAYLVARFVPNNTHETTLVLDVPRADAVKRAYAALSGAGRILQDKSPEPDLHVVRGVIKAGRFNMNPAIVTITLASVAPGRTGVHVRGVAKEGLIKQRAGEEAAGRIIGLLIGET